MAKVQLNTTVSKETANMLTQFKFALAQAKPETRYHRSSGASLDAVLQYLLPLGLKAIQAEQEQTRNDR